MSEFSDFLEDKLINITLRGGEAEGTAYNVPQAYLALYIGDPTDNPATGPGVEASWTNYVRQAVAFNAPVNGVTQNTADVIYPAVVGPTVEISHAAIYDSATGGNLLYHTALDIAKTFDADDIAMWGPNQLTVTLQ